MRLTPSTVEPGDFVVLNNVNYNMIMLWPEPVQKECTGEVRFLDLDKEPVTGIIASVKHENHKWSWCYIMLSCGLNGWFRLFKDEIELISRAA